MMRRVARQTRRTLQCPEQKEKTDEDLTQLALNDTNETQKWDAGESTTRCRGKVAPRLGNCYPKLSPIVAPSYA